MNKNTDHVYVSGGPVSPALTRAATITLCVFAAAFTALAALAWWHVRAVEHWSAIQFAQIFLPLLLAIVFSGISILSAAVRVGSAVTAIILMLGFIAVDSYVSRADVIVPEIRAARRLGVQFDGRLLKEVLFEARDIGEALTVPLQPLDRFGAFSNAAIFPNPALSKILLCNELGSIQYIESDEYGFNNPRGLWNTTKIDVLLIGDSFTEGWCVPHPARFAEVVRQVYPRTINLGRGGAGPLTELAILREYAPSLRPEVIVWCYYENDLADLKFESRVSVLSRYLREPAFSEDLYLRREEVNRLVHRHVEKSITTLRARHDLPFRGTRHLINTWVPRFINPERRLDPLQSVAEIEEVKPVFAATLRDAQRVARTLGAEIIIFYLRDFRMWPSDAEPTMPAQRAMVKNVAQELGIPVIDLAEAVNARFSDQREMHRLTDKHPIGAKGNIILHYNVPGHRLVGEVIVENLRKRFPHLGIH